MTRAAACAQRRRRRRGRPAQQRERQKGSVLLAVMLLMAIAVTMSAALMGRAGALAGEVQARRSVLCARYAALGGLALGTATTDPVAAAALVGPGVSLLAVTAVRLGPAWCVLRARASCRRATRTLERTMTDPSVCDAAPV